MTTDYAYPYTSADSGLKGIKCKKNTGNFKVSSFKKLTAGDCNNLLTELKKNPISIGIAGYRLQFYSSGVFNDCNSYIDHAVVLIGFKPTTGWKIKNSWGTDWGQKGYANIKSGNTCGICNLAVTPTL